MYKTINTAVAFVALCACTPAPPTLTERAPALTPTERHLARGCTVAETSEACEARQRAEFQASLTPEERQEQQQTRDDRDETKQGARQREADRLYCDMQAQQTYASAANPRWLFNLDANLSAAMVRDTCLRMRAAEHL